MNLRRHVSSKDQCSFLRASAVTFVALAAFLILAPTGEGLCAENVVILGRVLNEKGNGMANTLVYVSDAGPKENVPGQRQRESIIGRTTTDHNGNYKLTIELTEMQQRHVLRGFFQATDYRLHKQILTNAEAVLAELKIPDITLQPATSPDSRTSSAYNTQYLTPDERKNDKIDRKTRINKVGQRLSMAENAYVYGDHNLGPLPVRDNYWMLRGRSIAVIPIFNENAGPHRITVRARRVSKHRVPDFRIYTATEPWHIEITSHEWDKYSSILNLLPGGEDIFFRALEGGAVDVQWVEVQSVEESSSSQ